MPCQLQIFSRMLLPLVRVASSLLLMHAHDDAKQAPRFAPLSAALQLRLDVWAVWHAELDPYLKPRTGHAQWVLIHLRCCVQR